MSQVGAIALPEELSESRRAALLILLADDDPAIYRNIRQKILSLGPNATEWLRPHALSRDPTLRRRTQFCYGGIGGRVQRGPIHLL